MTRQQGMVDQSDNAAPLLAEAYEYLKTTDLPRAVESLERALKADFEREEVVFSLACARWWSERLARLDSVRTPYEQGEIVLAQWKSFVGFQRRWVQDFAPARYAFKRFAFSLALSRFESSAQAEPATETLTPVEADLALRIGRCLKGLGEYERSIQALEEAARVRRDDAEILAELADAYALVNEPRSSKALFREAFFLNPQKVDLGFLEGEAIVRLVDKLREMGYASPELEEWLPVHGGLLGVLGVKRELKAIEAGKLRQSVYELEAAVKESPERRGVLVPRLINRYFWLVDHYVAAREDKARIDEILLKIKLLDPSIYRQYVA